MNSFKRQKIFLHDEMRKCLRAIEKEECSPKYLRISECPIKGRGIKTCEDIQEGSFITYYKGKFTNKPPNDHTYMFALPAHNGNPPLFIDASKEDGSYARLLNDNHQNPNIRVKCITVNDLSYPCFFALRDIAKGEDLEFDYGGTDEHYPWRNSRIRNKERTESSSSCVSSQRDIGYCQSHGNIEITQGATFDPETDTRHPSEHCPLETRLKELEGKVNRICDVENKVQKIQIVQKKLKRDTASILKAVVANQIKIARLQRILKGFAKNKRVHSPKPKKYVDEEELTCIQGIGCPSPSPSEGDCSAEVAEDATADLETDNSHLFGKGVLANGDVAEGSFNEGEQISEPETAPLFSEEKQEPSIHHQTQAGETLGIDAETSITSLLSCVNDGVDGGFALGGCPPQFQNPNDDDVENMNCIIKKTIQEDKPDDAFCELTNEEEPLCDPESDKEGKSSVPSTGNNSNLDGNENNKILVQKSSLSVPSTGNKRQMRPCPFCFKFVKRFSDHLWCRHSKEKQMVEIKNTTNKKKKMQLFYQLRVAGLRIENEKRKGVGKLLVLRNPTKSESKTKQIIYQCSGCQMIYSRKGMSNHKRQMCFGRKTPPARGLGCIKMAPFKGVIDSQLEFLNEGFLEKVVHPMHDGKTKKEVMNDMELLYIGNFLFTKSVSTQDVRGAEYARKKLRYLTKIKLNYNDRHTNQKTPNIKLSEIFYCDKWFLLKKVIKGMIYKKVGKKLVLKNGASIQIKYALEHGLDALIGLYEFTEGKAALALVKELHSFKEAFMKIRNKVFGNISVVTAGRTAKENAAKRIPSKKNILTVVEKCDSVLDTLSALKILTEIQFVELRRAAVTRLILFNGRRPSEISMLKIKQWESAKINCYIPPEAEKQLNEEQLNLLANYKVMMTLEDVPVVVPKVLFKALDTLSDEEIRSNEGLGHQNGNHYLFPSLKRSENSCSGSISVESFLKSSLPESTRFTGLQVRRLLANKFVDVDYPREVRQVFNSFGHSINKLSHRCTNVKTLLESLVPALSRIANGYSKNDVNLGDSWDAKVEDERVQRNIFMEGQEDADEMEAMGHRQGEAQPEELLVPAPVCYKGAPMKSELNFQDAQSPQITSSLLECPNSEDGAETLKKGKRKPYSKAVGQQNRTNS